MEQYRLEFRAVNGYPSACNITIYRDQQIVIASETGEGMSVTNAADVIATEVVKQHGLDPKRMLFIEHYPADQRPGYGESYDLVTFRWDGKRFWNPDWRHLPPAEFNSIISEVEMKEEPRHWHVGDLITHPTYNRCLIIDIPDNEVYVRLLSENGHQFDMREPSGFLYNTGLEYKFESHNKVVVDFRDGQFTPYFEIL